MPKFLKIDLAARLCCKRLLYVLSLVLLGSSWCSRKWDFSMFSIALPSSDSFAIIFTPITAVSFLYLHNFSRYTEPLIFLCFNSCLRLSNSMMSPASCVEVLCGSSFMMCVAKQELGTSSG